MMSKISLLLFIPRTLETKCRRVYKCDLSEFELWTSETSLTFLLERREKTVKVLQWKFRIKEFRISSGIVLKNYLRRSWISQSLSRVDTDNRHFLFLTATSVKKTQLQTLVRLFLTRVVKPAHRCATSRAHGENVTAQYLRFIFSSHDNVDSVCQQQHFVNKIREDKSEGKHGRGRRSDSTCAHTYKTMVPGSLETDHWVSQVVCEAHRTTQELMLKCVCPLQIVNHHHHHHHHQIRVICMSEFSVVRLFSSSLPPPSTNPSRAISLRRFHGDLSSSVTSKTAPSPAATGVSVPAAGASSPTERRSASTGAGPGSCPGGACPEWSWGPSEEDCGWCGSSSQG